MDPKMMGRTDLPIDKVLVETISIDEFVQSRGINDIDFIKIDAEGAELLIAEGGLKHKSQTSSLRCMGCFMIV